MVGGKIIGTRQWSTEHDACGCFPRRYRLAPATARLPFLARPLVVERALVHVVRLLSTHTRCGYRLQTACCNSGNTCGRYRIRTSASTEGVMSLFRGRVRSRRDAPLGARRAPVRALPAACDNAGRPSGSNPSGRPNNRPPALLQRRDVERLRARRCA